ncbi:sugar transferase [uncultured Clostridium sp.]|uniref:sugar transferase n=1 Tax=uncultured Clostridium sp. TaxID=59620 RepID=UPI0025FAE7B3|nr:sugar transferase [uncultured Clostridium sp.]
MIVGNRAFYMVLDTLTVVFSYIVTSFLREGSLSGVMPSELWYRCILVICIYFLVALFYQEKKPLMKRSNFNELETVCSVNFQMALGLALLLYLFRVGMKFPRSFYLIFFIVNTSFMYMVRLSLKSFLYDYYSKSENRKKLILFANEENALKMMHKYVTSFMFDYEAVALVVISGHKDKGNLHVEINRILRGKSGSYMELSEKSLEAFLMREAIDEALVSMPESRRQWLRELILYMENLGIVTHVTTNTFCLGREEKVVEEFGIYNVLTYSPRIFDPAELFLKRTMDIAGGLAGVILTVMIGIVVAPMIYLESPGPVIFKQTRIGKNGRRFTIYKFRSMYMDAEQRKKELMAQNEMNGLMFKIKDDPRITRVGRFIRKTSLDEFPQFFNVLAGDMSLVGTRPPTEDEFVKYSERHKRRLSLKPGITGMWQVSGRSTVSDFEEIVNLDLEYIDNWSFWLDIKLLFQTVYVVLFQKGAS